MIASFGFCSRDTLQFPHPQQTQEKAGGKAYYSGLCLANLGERCLLFTYFPPQEQHFFQDLQHPNIQLITFPHEKIPIFENTYPSADLNVRYSRVSLSQFQFHPSLLSNHLLKELQSCSMIHLGPSAPEEMSLEFLCFLKCMNIPLAIDLEYVIKRKCSQGHFQAESPEAIQQRLPYLDIVMVSEQDIHFLGCSDEQQAISFLAQESASQHPIGSTDLAGPTEIIITKGSSGVLIHSKKDRTTYCIPAFPVKTLTDTTGAGDTFLAAYLFYRQTHSIPEAGKKAAEIAAKKIEKGSYYGK